MLAVDLIFMFLLSAGPALMYLYLMYQFVPKNMLNIKHISNYLLFGCVSPMMIIFLHFIFPDYTLPFAGSILISVAILSYIQIALTEEFSKYFFVHLVSKDDPNVKNTLPIQIVASVLLVSVGFAISENITYLMKVRNMILEESTILFCQGVNSTPLEIQINIIKSMISLATARAISAVVVHIVCGLIMGYFIAKIYYNKNKAKKYSKFNKWYYSAAGILCAAAYHGVYDMNILLPDNNTWGLYFHCINLVVGLLIGYLIVRSVIESSKKISKNNLKNTTTENETGG